MIAGSTIRSSDMIFRGDKDEEDNTITRPKVVTAIVVTLVVVAMLTIMVVLNPSATQ